MFISDDTLWARELFDKAQLGDPRRNQRLITYLGHQAQAARSSTAEACPSAAHRLGAYRLLHNPHFDTDALNESAFDATIASARGAQRVLAVEDTTVLSYAHSVRHQLGLIGSDKNGHRRGYLSHGVLLVNADHGGVYGLVAQHWWLREARAHGKKHRRRKRSYQDKESAVWEASSRQVRRRIERAGLEAEVISVCDRGADVHEYLQYKTEQKEAYVVRSNQNRLLTSGLRVEAHMQQVAPVETNWQVQIQGRKEAVSLEIRTAQVELKPTSRRGQPQQERLRAIGVQVVDVRESNPPQGERALHWRLYTSVPVMSFEEALEVIGYYRLRWRIEEWHKAWKSDCTVETRRLRSREALKRLAVLLGWIAVRMIQLQQLEQAAPEAPSTRVFTREEVECLWAVTEGTDFPEIEPTVQWAKAALAKLGNFYDSQRTGRPGRSTLQKGLWRLKEIHLGWQLARQQKDL